MIAESLGVGSRAQEHALGTLVIFGHVILTCTKYEARSTKHEATKT